MSRWDCDLPPSLANSWPTRRSHTALSQTTSVAVGCGWVVTDPSEKVVLRGMTRDILKVGGGGGDGGEEGGGDGGKS